jgi:enamine deaminase RidA (YjgF/YER057c/UK114 family)
MTRQSIDIDSFAHENPIPVATRIGPLLISGVIPAFDPGTRNLPAKLEDQVANLFEHIGNALAVAGGTWDDVAKITFFANDPQARSKINPSWLEKFPDAASRPSRHTQITRDDRPPSITCDFTAWIGG